MNEGVVEFLDRHQIMWTWNFQHIDKNGKKNFVCFQQHGYNYPEGHGKSKRSPSHFKSNTQLVKIQSDYYRKNRDIIHNIANRNGWSVNILHDTSHGHLIIDIDDVGFLPEVEKLLCSVPYYLSLRKKLPHLFVFSERMQHNNSSVSYEDGSFDLLHGLWSSAPDDAVVYNSRCSIYWNFETWLNNYTCREKKTSGCLPPAVECKGHLHSCKSLENEPLYKLCGCIAPERWHNRMEWFYLACAIKSTSCVRKYEIWRHFSAQSSSYREENYEEGGTDWNTWQSINRADITVRSLRFYAKKDNVELYTNIRLEIDDYFAGNVEEIDEIMDNALHSCSHQDVAELYLHLSGDNHKRFVYVEGANSTWYECREPDYRWFKSKGVLLDHSIVVSIVPKLDEMMSILCGKKSISREKIRLIEDRNIRDKLLQIFELKRAVKTKTFRDQVMRNLQYYLLDRCHIETKFDFHKHLIAFNNGLFDFKQRRFRPIDPMDFITKSTGYDYKSERNDEDRKIILSWMYSLFMKKEDGDYVLKVLSSLFHGDNYEQEVYILNGEGCNGKSVLINVVSSLLGNSNSNGPSE